MQDIRCVSFGSRMYYAIPRILYETQNLEMFYTDFSSNKFPGSLLKAIPNSLQIPKIKKLIHRNPEGIPSNKIIQFRDLGLREEIRLRLENRPEKIAKIYLLKGERIAKRVINQGFDNLKAVFVIGSTSEKIFKEAKKNNVHTIMESIIAPPSTQIDVLESEWNKFPKWEIGKEAKKNLSFWQEEVMRDYQIADSIICGSKFVEDEILKLGINKESIVTIPYGVSLNIGVVKPKNFNGLRKLRVLTSGTISLLKGSPYLFETSRILHKVCDFRVIGRNGIPESILSEYKNSIEFLGHLSKEEMLKSFEWADVFLLPSLCEGSATVCYEAMNYGLPLIVTPNTGQFIKSGKEGFVIPIKSTDAIVESLQKFLNQPDLVEYMSKNALQLANYGSYLAYKERINNFIQTL